MRALVTGGAGFIGSHVVDALVAQGADAVVLDDLSTGYAEHVNPAAELIEGDIADPDAVAKAVGGCDVVFHEAAHKAVFRSVEYPLETDRANTGGTLTVLLGARDAGVRRFVYASSSSIYGGAAPRPTPEDAPLLPRSPYAVSKLAGEQYARVCWELYGLETVSLRYFNVFGPRQRPDSQYAAVIPLFIEALRTGVRPVVHGDGCQSRDFTYISDVVAANLRAAEAPVEQCAGRAFNIAGGKEQSLLDLLRVLEDVIGTKADAEHTDPRPGDVRHSCAEVSAAAADLGWEAVVPFTDGLRRTVEWFTNR